MRLSSSGDRLSLMKLNTVEKLIKVSGSKAHSLSVVLAEGQLQRSEIMLMMLGSTKDTSLTVE
jgi:hypothetical protein